MEILAFFGVIVGFIAGFFGVGGGSILVPLLMLLGYTIKEAVGVSIIQMLFSSVYGSAIHFKAGRLDVKVVLYLGIGGAMGAFLSAYVVQLVSNLFLEILFLSVIIVSLIKLFYTPHAPEHTRILAPWVLMIVGMFVGVGAISIGVGGAIFIIPFLHAYMGYPLKKAVVASLFFVTFSSFFAFINWSIEGQLLFKEGLVVGLFSMLGVYLGIKVAVVTNPNSFKFFMLILNSAIFLYLVYKIFLG